MKLWHMRLGHMSEKGMVILSKRGLLGVLEFNDFCRDEGIARHYTVCYTPQQNWVAERMNRTLLERTRCLLWNAGLNRNFWAEALNTACYLINRSPATAIDCKTPIEVWSGKPADYSKLRVFGCPAYYHVLIPRLDRFFMI
ncbi:retrovirus-related pol polyprotein from transposon TNT 1-94 [Tanacetum coccineum]